MSKTRIQIYTDSEIKRRVELAAAQREISVTEYCLHAIRAQLADDDLLDRDRVEITVVPDPATGDLMTRLRHLQAEILAARGGVPLDLDQALTDTRAERDDELLGLR